MSSEASKVTSDISAVRRSSTCANPAPPRSRTTASRPPGSINSSNALSISGGPANMLRSSTKTSAFPDRGLSDRSGFAQMTAEVALGHVGSCSGLEVSRHWPATMPTGTACSICAASPTR